MTLTSKQIKQVFERFQQNNPNPTTKLDYKSNFELLVAVVLSAQATDVSVNKATKALFKKADTPQKMLALTEEGLKNYIQSIGLYNTKAKNLIKTCELLIKYHQGEVPSNREDLENLPGVGRKTANVILNTAFGLPTVAVDTHIFRVSNRIPLGKGKDPLEVEQELLKVIPKLYLKDAHHWLILHGRYICTARNPKCVICPIQDLCQFKSKNLTKAT